MTIEVGSGVLFGRGGQSQVKTGGVPTDGGVPPGGPVNGSSGSAGTTGVGAGTGSGGFSITVPPTPDGGGGGGPSGWLGGKNARAEPAHAAASSSAAPIRLLMPIL